MSVETMSQLFINTIRSYPKNNLLMYKKGGKYVSISSPDVWDRVRFLSLGPRSLGLQPGDKLIILGENCPDWVMADFAALCAGATTVPIYPNLMPEQMKYIIDDSDAKVVVCSTRALWRKVETVRKDLTKVTHAILFEDEAPQGVQTLASVIEKGKGVAARGADEFEKTALGIRPG